MLTTKLITIASAIALAMSSTTAVEQASHLRVSVHHHHKGGPCSGPEQSPMSVEGAAGVYCVSGPPCVANNHGACPGPQPGLEWGSSCGTVASGVQGCKVNTAAPEEEPVEEEDSWEHEEANVCSGEGETPMSVEGLEQIFCVTGQACVAHYKDGACPGPQAGLEYGSSCGKVETGVYGCLPNGQEEEGEEEAASQDEEEHDSWTPENEDDSVVIVIDIEDTSCGEGETPMSVEGVETIYCVPGQACVDHFKDGACPGPQEGLAWGSSCTKIDTDVYGCTPNGSEEEEEASEEDATVVEEEEEESASKDNDEEGSAEEEEEEEEEGEASQSQDASKEEDETTEGEGEDAEEPTHDWEDATEEPTEGEVEPTEGEAEPTEGEAEPTEGEAEPTEGEAEPTEGEAEPTEGEADEGATEETTEGDEETPEAPTEAPTEVPTKHKHHHKHHHKKHHHKH